MHSCVCVPGAANHNFCAGLIVSSILAGSHERSIYQKICDDISGEELEVMHTCGIGRGDDSLTKEDFIVLMLVRIGAAPTQLVQKLHERFRTLDRKKEGRIAYDDIVYGRKKQPTRKDIITKLFVRSFSTTSLMGGMRRMSGPDSRVSPNKVHPSTPSSNGSFADMQIITDHTRTADDWDKSSCRQDPSRRHWNYTETSPIAIEEGRDRSQGLLYVEKESQLGASTSYERHRASSAPPVMCVPSNTRRDSAPLEPFEHESDAGSTSANSEGGANAGGVLEMGGLVPCPRRSLDQQSSRDHEDEDEDEDEDDDGDKITPMESITSLETSSSRRMNGPPRMSKVVAYQLDVQKRQDLLSTIRKGKNKQLLQTIKEYFKLIIKDSHFVLFCIW